MRETFLVGGTERVENLARILDRFFSRHWSFQRIRQTNHIFPGGTTI